MFFSETNTSNDSLLVLETRFQNVSQVIIQQEEEIARLNNYCRSFQIDLGWYCFSITLVMIPKSKLYFFCDNKQWFSRKPFTLKLWFNKLHSILPQYLFQNFLSLQDVLNFPRVFTFELLRTLLLMNFSLKISIFTLTVATYIIRNQSSQ